MGRKHFTTQIPQHSRHGRERTRRREAGEGAPLAFGIRRPLESESSQRLLAGVRQLQLAGELPPGLQVSPRIHVPLLSLRAFGKQANQGLLGDYDIEDMQRKLRRRCPSWERADVEAEIRRVTLRGGKELDITLVSPEITSEYSKIAEVMGKFGVRGLHREAKQKAISMNAGSIRPLSELEREELDQPKLPSFEERQTAEQTVLQLVDDIHRVEIPVTFEPWEIFPVYQQAA